MFVETKTLRRSTEFFIDLEHSVRFNVICYISFIYFTYSFFVIQGIFEYLFESNLILNDRFELSNQSYQRALKWLQNWLAFHIDIHNEHRR